MFQWYAKLTFVQFMQGNLTKLLHKQKVFVWLFLVDRLNTRDMMARRHWHLDSGVNCAMCSRGQRETRDHLFFNCSFARKCWAELDITWSSAAGTAAMFDLAKQNFAGPKFFEVATCALWGLWKQRNNHIFEGAPFSVPAWKAVFKKDLGLLVHRVKVSHKKPLEDWIAAF